MEVTVRPGQTLPDIAIQVYGDLRAVIDLAAENGLSITEAIQAGKVLRCQEVMYDRYMQDYVRENGLSPATEPANGDISLSLFTEQFTDEFR